MVKLSSDDVIRLAKLAKLELSDSEVKSFAKELGDILGYVEQHNLFLVDIVVHGKNITVSADSMDNITIQECAKLAKALIARLEEAIRQTISNPDFAKSAERLAVTPAFLPATEFGRVIAKEDAEIAQIMQALGLKKTAQ